METTITLSQEDREVTKSDICKARPSVGNNEAELALQKALVNYNGDNQRLLSFALDALDAHRKPFIGDYTYAGTETWKKAYADSERAAEHELLSESPQLAARSSLERAAADAKTAAEKKAREMQSLWTDFQSLHGKMERLRSRMARLQLERAELDLAIFRLTLKRSTASTYLQRTYFGVQTRTTINRYSAGETFGLLSLAT